MPRCTYVFEARLEGWPGVSRQLAIRSHHSLIDLHHLLQSAFGWDDDHLYAFWLGNRFWPRTGNRVRPNLSCSRKSR